MCPTEDIDYRTEAYVLFYQAKGNWCFFYWFKIILFLKKEVARMVEFVYIIWRTFCMKLHRLWCKRTLSEFFIWTIWKHTFQINDKVSKFIFILDWWRWRKHKKEVFDWYAMTLLYGSTLVVCAETSCQSTNLSNKMKKKLHTGKNFPFETRKYIHFNKTIFN